MVATENRFIPELQLPIVGKTYSVVPGMLCALLFLGATGSTAFQDDGNPITGRLQDSLEHPLGDSLEDPLADVWSDNCETLDPANGTAQIDACPYKLSISKNSITTDQSVTFTLKAPRPLVFKGFIVQARDDHTGEAVGEFDSYYVDVKITNCFARRDNTVTHVDYSPKTKIVLRWAPDSNDEASVTFFATIAQEVTPSFIYWKKQRVGTVHISKAA